METVKAHSECEPRCLVSILLYGDVHQHSRHGNNNVRVEKSHEAQSEDIGDQGRIDKGNGELTYIFRLDIGMDKVTFIMKVLKTEKDLLRDNFDNGTRHPLLLIPFYQCKEIFAQRFEHDTNMRCLRALIRKGIEEGNDVRSARVCWRE